MSESIGMFSMLLQIGYFVLAILTISLLSWQAWRWWYSSSQQDRDDGKKSFIRILIGSALIASLPLIYYGFVDKSKINEYSSKGNSRLMNDLKTRVNNIDSSSSSSNTSSSSSDLFGTK